MEKIVNSNLKNTISMCQMEFFYIIERLSAVRLEIRELRKKESTSIKETIQILKDTNTLLREQNHLLTLRQEALAKKLFNETE